MGMTGIICEYNPFHNGHKVHIEETRRLTGEEQTIVCVMSGDFVQRGEAAVYSKFARAEAACRCGADLIIELPLPWALSSAEGFARGAVGLLGALGVEKLSFGSETGELAPLEQAAQILLEPGFQQEIKTLLLQDGSLSYAAARQQAMAARTGDGARLLERPNNILGIEYLKAIYDLRLEISPFAVTRQGSGHDRENPGPGPRSASELRSMIFRGESISGHIPGQAAQVYAKERELGREIADRSAFEIAALSRLRFFDEEYFKSLPDGGDGLGSRLYRAVREEGTLNGILASAKTKRYALARIRRMLMCACLGVKAGMNRGLPPYARVLAANEKGRAALRELGKNSLLPLITKPATVKGLSAECEALFSLGASAHDFYVLGYCAPSERKAGNDWRTGPKIVENP